MPLVALAIVLYYHERRIDDPNRAVLEIDFMFMIRWDRGPIEVRDESFGGLYYNLFCLWRSGLCCDGHCLFFGRSDGRLLCNAATRNICNKSLFEKPLPFFACYIYIYIYIYTHTCLWAYPHKLIQLMHTSSEGILKSTPMLPHVSCICHHRDRQHFSCHRSILPVR